MSFSAIDILEEFVEANQYGLSRYERHEPGLSYRRSRAAIELARRSYKTSWENAKYRKDPIYRARKSASDKARYARKKMQRNIESNRAEDSEIFAPT